MSNPPRAPEPPSQTRRRLLASEHALHWVLLSAAVIALFAVGAQARDVILYNESPSMPVGLYARTNARMEHGAVVTVRAADVAHDYARMRGFVGPEDRFIKRVVGVTGDTVCAHGDVVTLNGAEVARRQVRDSAGRMLPTWVGCRTLSESEVLLLGETDDSFDGRYWGVVQVSEIEGVWRPLFVNSTQGN